MAACARRIGRGQKRMDEQDLGTGQVQMALWLRAGETGVTSSQHAARGGDGLARRRDRRRPGCGGCLCVPATRRRQTASEHRGLGFRIQPARCPYGRRCCCGRLWRPWRMQMREEGMLCWRGCISRESAGTTTASPADCRRRPLFAASLRPATQLSVFINQCPRLSSTLSPRSGGAQTTPRAKVAGFVGGKS